jgi:hypothetical protein
MQLLTPSSDTQTMIVPLVANARRVSEFGVVRCVQVDPSGLVSMLVVAALSRPITKRAAPEWYVAQVTPIVPVAVVFAAVNVSPSVEIRIFEVLELPGTPPTMIVDPFVADPPRVAGVKPSPAAMVSPVAQSDPFDE